MFAAGVSLNVWRCVSYFWPSSLACSECIAMVSFLASTHWLASSEAQLGAVIWLAGSDVIADSILASSWWNCLAWRWQSKRSVSFFRTWEICVCVWCKCVSVHIHVCAWVVWYWCKPSTLLRSLYIALLVLYFIGLHGSLTTAIKRGQLSNNPVCFPYILRAWLIM